MSDVQDYLLNIDNNKSGATGIAQATAAKLESKQVTLIDIVHSLEKYISDEDAAIRSKAVNYLSSVISALSSSFLTRQQVQVLCQFLCDRIEDGGAVGGLAKLQSLGRFNKDMAVMIFRAMLEHFRDLQLRPQSQRLQILQLLNDLMYGHRPALKSLESESLVGIIDLVSGEKDPRNLMIIFSILKVVMVEWDITGHAETLFDSIFCYFPITFRPPPDDPYGITAQDLKDRLRDCIASSRYFAPFAFPQLIDKLDSTSPNVKKDVLQTISKCGASYDITTISNYSITLWDSLKYEILNVQEEELAEEALIALQAIAIRLSQGLSSTNEKAPLAGYLQPIIKECNEQLREPQHKQAKPAGKILSYLGATSSPAFYLIVKAVLPPLLALYQDADSIAKQRALLEVLSHILGSAIIVYGTLGSNTPFPGTENPLEPFRDRLFQVFSQALMSTPKEEVSFRIVSLKCLLRLCNLRKYLQDNEIGMAVQYFDEIVLLESFESRDELKNEAIQALVEISQSRPSLIMDITLPAFMAKLPDFSARMNVDYIATLEALARLSVQRVTSDTLIRRLLNKLDLVLQNDGSPTYSQAILSTLTYVLSRRELAGDPNLDFYYEQIVVRLINRAALASIRDIPKSALGEVKSLEILGRLSNLIVRALETHKQDAVVAQTYSLFCEGETFTPVLFRNDASQGQRSTLILSTYLLAAIKHDARLPYTKNLSSGYYPLLNELIRLALEEDMPFVRRNILRQIGLLVNKFLLAKDVHFATDILLGSGTGLLSASNVSLASIPPMFWIAKALILRLANTDEVLKRLMELLPHTAHGAAAARGFELILAPDEILSKDNGATIRLLAKQKVFNVCIPTIATAFRNADSSVKANYLIALSGILKHIPTAVLMLEIDIILPLLLQSLDLQESDVKAATIQTLAVVSRENPKAVEGHISSLVNRLLKSAADPGTETTVVRYNALRCLRMFPGKVKDSALLPYRKAVIKGMLTILDDPRRNVRKEAVDCRTEWLNMDEPEEDE